MMSPRTSRALLLLLLSILGANGAAFSKDWGSNYTWKACVDRATGTATSLETSRVPTHSKLANTVANADDLRSLSRNLFDRYPVWLCQCRNTFGLLKAVPTADGGYQIKTRLFGVNILLFGEPFSRRSFALTKKDSSYTVVLPFTGGYLSLAGPIGDRGSLNFALHTRRRRKKTGKTTKSETSPPTSQIVTGLSGYRPTLCGNHIPTSHLRVNGYLASQSIIHGFVMWRFHRHCRGFDPRNPTAT